MPDVLVDDGLLTHPKLAVFAEALEVAPVAAVGHLISLWGWVSLRYPDGNLSGISHAAIALGSSYHGPSAPYFKALSDAGFLDNGRATTEVHDWSKHTGKLVARRAYDAKRKRQHRIEDPDKVRGQETVRRQRDRDRDPEEKMGRPELPLLDKAWHDAFHEIEGFTGCVTPDLCWKLHEWIEKEKVEGFAALEVAKDMRDQLIYNGKTKRWFYEAQGKRRGNYSHLHRVFRSWIKRRRQDEAARAGKVGRPSVPTQSAFKSEDPWDA
jgi:hypothetical protein